MLCYGVYCTLAVWLVVLIIGDEFGYFYREACVRCGVHQGDMGAIGQGKNKFGELEFVVLHLADEE